MRLVVAALVLAGVASAVLVGLTARMDVFAYAVLGLIVALGALAIAISTQAHKGAVTPDSCATCGGLVSRSAPYCKHCGARF